MSRKVLVMGESGTGKSTSIRTLDPKTTFIITALGKDFPFKGSGKMYTLWDKEKNPEGNLIVTTNATVILSWLKFISEKMSHIKTIVLEDSTHFFSLEYMRRIKETTWDKWNDIAASMVSIAQTAQNLREDLVVFFMHHVTSEGDGVLEEKRLKAMTLGKLVETKLSSYESFFTEVLLAVKAKIKDGKVEHYFLTRDANSTAKTPMGMFDEEYIPNDLELVRTKMLEFYN